MRARSIPVLVVAALAACRGGDALVHSSVDTAAFDGEYVLDADRSFEKMRRDNAAAPDPARRARGEALLRIFAERFANFRIHRGVIRSGTRLVQEFSLKQATVEGPVLRATAVWHEDVADPGDMNDVGVVLRRDGDVLEFSLLGDGGEVEQTVYLTRKR